MRDLAEAGPVGARLKPSSSVMQNLSSQARDVR